MTKRALFVVAFALAAATAIPSTRSFAQDSGPLRIETEGKIGVLTRAIEYNDDYFNTLRTFAVGAAPHFAYFGSIHPFAFFLNELWPDFALFVEGGIAIMPDSIDAQGVAYPTSSWSFSAGAQLDHSFGPITVGLFGAYGTDTLTIDPAGPNMPRPDLPDIAYQFWRVGTHASFGIAGPLFADVEFAYRFVTGTGAIGESYFPHAQAAGIDTTIRLEWRFDNVFAIPLEATLLRYFFDMKSVPGDDWVAGGAVDQTVFVNVSVAVRY